MLPEDAESLVSETHDRTIHQNSGVLSPAPRCHRSHIRSLLAHVFAGAPPGDEPLFLQVLNHLALALTDGRHVDSPVILGDAEFLASPEVRSNFRAMDDVLARETGDVFAGTSDIFSLNVDGLHALFGQGPGY
jgi:hypothetical protein